MKKGLLIILSILLLLPSVSCGKPHSEQETVAWNGTLLDFIVRDNTMYMGKVLLPCERQDLIDAGIFPKGTEFPDDSRTAEKIPYMIAPEKAYFSDLEEEAWVIYKSSEESVFTCSLIFAKSDQEARDQLYHKVYGILHEGFGTSDALGSLGIRFRESRIPKLNLETLDTYGWDIEEDQYAIYGYSLVEPEQYGETGWMGKIQETAGQYGFQIGIEYFGEEKRKGIGR